MVGAGRPDAGHSRFGSLLRGGCPTAFRRQRHGIWDGTGGISQRSSGNLNLLVFVFPPWNVFLQFEVLGLGSGRRTAENICGGADDCIQNTVRMRTKSPS